MQRSFDVHSRFPMGGNIRTPKSVPYRIKEMSAPLTLFNANTQKNDPLGTPKRIVLHWTAGASLGVWDDYHYNIVWDPAHGKPYLAAALKITQKGQHLFGRNGGSVGIAFCARNASYVYPAMIEMAALLCAEICHKYKLDPNGTQAVPDMTLVGERLVATGKPDNVMPVITDHAHYAVIDGYYPDRVDCGSQERRHPERQPTPKVKSKVSWYMEQIKVDAKTKRGLYEFDAVI